MAVPMEVVPSIQSMPVLEARSSTGVSDSTDVEGGERHHRSICSAEYSSAKEIPDTDVPHTESGTSPAYITCEG